MPHYQMLVNSLPERTVECALGVAPEVAVPRFRVIPEPMKSVDTVKGLYGALLQFKGLCSTECIPE
jgi:hypothetical protein